MKRIYVALVPTEGKILKCDVISWQYKFWLVPEWLENISEKKMKPARIISMENLSYQSMMENPDYQFILNDPLPSKWDSTSEKGYQIIDYPDIVFDIQES